MKKYLFNLLGLIFSSCLFAQVPSYYDGLNLTLMGEALKTELSNHITNTHTYLLTYTPGVWNAVKQTDLVPGSTEDVFLIYGYDNSDMVYKNDRTRDKDLNCTSSSCYSLWTREHVFPKSLANPKLETEDPSPGTDAHNLRACDSQMNSSRSNRVFEDGSGNATITPSGDFYPGDEWKGDVARIIMYMYLRYPTQCLAVDVADSPRSYSVNMPDVFLEWNAEDPPNEYELNRNQILETLQGNRNPFIDNPYLATTIWGGPEAQNNWESLNISEPKTNVFESVKIYPNPCVDQLNISDNIDLEKAIIYDMTGTQIATVKKHEVNVSNLPSGIYIIQLITTAGESKAFKFTKR